MRVLIIGCGYVGLALGSELARKGHEVFGLRRTLGPELEAAGIKPLTGDVTQPETLANLPTSYDWVAFCVSSSGGGGEDYQRVYFEGARNVLGWLANSPPKKLVYTSSTSVYGQNDGSTVDEKSPVGPFSETSKILLATEQLLLEAARRDGFPVVILRVAGIYGPGRGYWLKQFLQGTARLEGQGERILNMIHRDDVAGAMEAALVRGVPGEIYNAVDDEPVTQFELFKWLAQRLKKPLPIAMENPGEHRKRAATNKRISNQRLRQALGYDLKFPTFREGFGTLLAG
jgi:nucleoside-diphosphate-sugar epimerase